ncbi:hypothetical protein IE81DRAFT_201778 [Ceraceosorus guamensis]|uniref:Uncharacterized protein n=1 Tax=Ceraceosorus guamensis TaxID=1522189 RepID=A0A316VUE8_9BASI|nr:hypothetical protein IE81DRAFT_201778 [Ceraceosorus guamensis]PWN40864.1 hypothetical protein IE81DRAFT_201778 [Ceraceosorus guamensis]
MAHIDRQAAPIASTLRAGVGGAGQEGQGSAEALPCAAVRSCAGSRSGRRSMEPIAESSSDTIEKAIDLALHASPPLLFWAGYDVTRLVDASYLVQWTIPIAAEPVEEREPSRSPSVELVDAPNKRRRRQPREGGSPDLPRLLLGREQDVDAPRRYDAGARRASAVKMRGRIFPRIWYDLYGNIVEKEWERGLGVVLGWVFEQPGVTQVHLIKLLSPTYDRLEAVELIEGACATQAISKRTPTSVSGSPDPDPDQVALLPTSKDWTSWASSSRTDALKPFISRFATAAFKGAKRVAAAIEERDKESLEGSASDGEGEGEGADEDEDEDEEDEDEDEDEQEDEQEED